VKYIIFVIDQESGSGGPDEMVEIDKFNEALRANGNWVFAAGIGAPSTASIFDSTAGDVEMIGESLNVGPDFYSGFWIIEASSQDEARSLAAKGSKACNRKVELRPFLGS
jgi:hypothetical protein